MVSNSKIRRQNSNQFGRMGGFFSMSGTEDVYGISNNHVIANLNTGVIGDIICDGENTPIGSLTDWIILNANADNKTEFALFKIDAPAELQWADWEQFKNTPPAGFMSAKTGAAVFYPQQGSVSKGLIKNIGFAMQLILAGNTYVFVNCIKIEATDGTKFSDHGDSGGCIFSADNQLVGILVAIKDDGSASYAVPFVDGILNYYNLQIIKT